MADVAAGFLAIALLTFAGFVAGRIFQRTRVPDVLLLLGLGLLLGPVNRALASRGLGWDALASALDPATLRAATPVLAGIALVVLVFDAGLQLDFGPFRKGLRPALVHTLPIFFLTALGVAAVGVFLLGMPPLVAAVLAVALTNVDQVVSSGVLQGLRIPDRQRAIYTIEMAVYDLVCIPLIVSLMALADGTGTPALFVRQFAVLLSVSLAAGLAAGIPWLFALRTLSGHPHSYMLTFATMIGVYGASELLGGSGALSILLFGILVGNRTAILRRFARVREDDGEHAKVVAFHDELTFLVRTLFFLFLGASFTFEAGLWPAEPAAPFAGLGPGALFLVAAFLFLAVIVAARYLAVRLATRRDPGQADLFGVFGRGLDTAVLATLPFLAPAYVEGRPFYDLFHPWEAAFTNLSLLLVLLTVAASGLVVWRQERAQDRFEAESEVVVPLREAARKRKA